MSDIDVITLGCRLNASESDAVAAIARDDGLSDAVIINTCAVTNDAVAESRRRIRKARRERPGAQIIVTGCAAQIDPQGFASMAEVDRVVGNHDKMLPGTFAPERTERVLVNDIMAVQQTAPQFMGSANRGVRAQSRTRAFLQVQNGCDHRCTFCIIPFGRGNARSVPAGEVVGHVRALVAQDYREVVLTGVDLSSWGGDLPGRPPLGDLVRRILKLVPELPRLRLSSIDPAEVDPVLMDLLTTEPRLAPYLHLSLQAGDDMILKRMARRHSRSDAVALCASLKSLRPEITFGADLIAGFPTETDAMFANTLSIVSEIGIPWLHVFPYSAREGTPAARIPPVDGRTVKARARALREAGARELAKHLQSRVGQLDTALFEADGTARLPDFSRFSLLGAGRNAPPPAGSLRRVEVLGISGEQLTGSLYG